MSSTHQMKKLTFLFLISILIKVTMLPAVAQIITDDAPPSTPTPGGGGLGNRSPRRRPGGGL